MSSVTELRQKRDELIQRADKANSESTKPENAEDREALEAEFDTCMAQIEDLDKQIARAERVAKLLNGQSKPAEANNEVQLDKESDPCPVKIPAQARRHVPEYFQNRTIHGMDADHRAYAFGRFMLATAARTQPGKFGHLSGYIQAHTDSFGPMNAATEAGAEGIWVPEQFGTDLIVLMKRYGIARQICNVVTMTSDTRTDPKEGSDPAPVFVGEASNGSDVTPTDDDVVRLTAKKLMAILIHSSELNDDAIMEFGDSTMRRLANGFAKKEDDCLYQGDGTSTYGGIVGLKTKLQDIDGAGTDSFGLVGGTGAWSALTLADHEKVVAKLPDYADTGAEDSPNAVWTCHRTYFFEVMSRLALASGGVTSMEVQNGTRRPAFLGYPVRFTNSMPSATATSTVSATFGDHRKAVNFGDRKAYSVSFSTEATVGSVNLWQSDQIGIRAVERFDINVHSLGSSTEAGPVVGLRTSS
jgi:HK97 family phage major capsid protein